MPHSVNILFDGYCKISEDEPNCMYANCTCTLIKGDKNIIIDTMQPWNRDDILSGLVKHELTPDDIDFVISTHGHSDHVGNNNLFLKKAIHIVGQNVSYKDKFFLHDFDEPYVINDDIEVVATPGHTHSCVSIIVKSQKIAIVGDLFENAGDIEDCSLWIDAGSENTKLQRENRYKIAKQVEYIIPGHGTIFKVTDAIRYKLKCDLEEE